MVETVRCAGPRMEGLVLGADITGEQQVCRADPEFDRRRAEDMAGVPQPRAETGRRREPAFEIDLARKISRGVCIRLGIDRPQGRAVAPVGSTIASLDLPFLDASGVGQHLAQQVAGRRGTPDRAVEPFGDQPRQQAAMVDMRMSQQNRIEGTRVEAEALVIERLECARPLEKAAVDKEAATAKGDLEA